MSSLLLDAGVWLASRDLDDRFHAEARALVEARAGKVAALDLTLYEVANVAVGKWESVAEARRLVDLVLVACGGGLVRADAELLHSASDVAVRRNVTAYDAAYVACAERERLQLVSTDFRDLVDAGLAISPAAANELA